MPLSSAQIQHFIQKGYVKVEHAFSQELADVCRGILWKATQADPDDPDTWTQPVVRIGEIGLPPFQAAANTPVLLEAFQQLAGDNWLPRASLGSFPIRFPSKTPAGDTGWHVDASFPGDEPSDYMQWRINVQSRGRALLMLFLFSDVGENDAPTLIQEGSHLEVAKILAPHGPSGLSFMELAGQLDSIKGLPLTQAIGEAGTVYLCHPFLVHAAQDHKGSVPKFMAQPPLLSKRDFDIFRNDTVLCPIEIAIKTALGA
ncbi:MAG: hypothetical protein JNM22_18480 [Saprospiraceae bacterium]|nr:hypothetical protein [Saprospiraceae bacterium]